MEDHLYERQQLLGLNDIESATIVGVGGTGSWSALFLAMAGCLLLNLFDADRIEYHNLARLPFEPDTVGRIKAEVVAELIQRLRPDCIVNCYGRATPYSLNTVETKLLFDCTDNQDTQTMLSEWAKKHGARYIRVGYDGTHLTVTSFNSTWRTSDSARTGYEVVPSWVVGAALPACLGVAKAMYAPNLEVSTDIMNIGGKR